MNHKHVSENEILEYIKKKGKIHKIDEKIKNCKECYNRFKHIFYRTDILSKTKEIKKSKKFNIITIDFEKNENYDKAFYIPTTQDIKTYYRGGQYIIRKFNFPLGEAVICMDINYIRIEFNPKKESKEFKIKIIRENLLIAETQGGSLKLPIETMKNVLISIIIKKERYDIFLNNGMKLPKQEKM